MAEEEPGGHTGHANTDWCLERLGGDPPGQRLQLLPGTEVTLGRGLGVTHQLLAKDSSLMISRNHCCFRLTAVGACTVTDNQSVNGVWVNGCRLVAHQPRALCEGDLVQLGVPVEQHKQAEFEYRLVRRAAGAGSTATSPPLPPRVRAKRKLECRDTELGATQDNAGSSSKVQRLSEDQLQPHAAPGPQRDTAPGPESERDTQRDLGTERDTEQGAESERDPARGPESDRDTARGPESDRDTAQGPGTERDTEQGPQSDRDTARGPESDRDTARGPESDRDTARGPESDMDTAQGSGSERDTARGPGTERDTERGLESHRDTARGPESDRDTVRGPGTERGPESDRDTARGPESDMDTAQGSGSERDTARGPESERDTARDPRPETDVGYRDTARGPGSERDTAQGPESDRDTARDPGPETDLGYRDTARGLGTAGGQGQSEQREYPGTGRDPGPVDAARGPGPERDRQHGDQDKNQGFGDREPARGVCDDSRLADEQQPQAGACGESAETRLSELLENELQCIICSQHFVQAVTLGCSHSFCGPCIGEWSRRRPECPMCRRPIRWQTRSLVLDGCVERLLARTGPPHPPSPPALALTPAPNGCSTERHTQQ